MSDSERAWAGFAVFAQWLYMIYLNEQIRRLERTKPKAEAPMPNDPIPNPGSREAVKLGCTCPVADNHYGYGVRSRRPGEAFVIAGDCPVHTWKEDVNAE